MSGEPSEHAEPATNGSSLGTRRMSTGRAGETGGVQQLCVYDCVLFVDAWGDEMGVHVCVCVFPQHPH